MHRMVEIAPAKFINADLVEEVSGEIVDGCTWVRIIAVTADVYEVEAKIPDVLTALRQPWIVINQKSFVSAKHIVAILPYDSRGGQTSIIETASGFRNDCGLCPGDVLLEMEKALKAYDAETRAARQEDDRVTGAAKKIIDEANAKARSSCNA